MAMPVIWLIDAYRSGERGQVRALADALADALGWPCEIKQLDYRYWAVLPHALGWTTPGGLSPDAASKLRAPWPDLVISCGVRNEPVCRWIRQQSAGKTRYVHVGRPWGKLSGFDLVVTTPQYRVPAAANVLHNTLTLHQVTAKRLAESANRWRDRFSTLPQPHIAVIVGGNSGPFTLGRKAAERLARQASSLAREYAGSLLVTTSSRTPRVVTRVLRETIDVPHYFYEWRGRDDDNPYFGILALGAQLVVTADSIAMISEACATGKPVQLFDLGGMCPQHELPRDFRFGGMLYAGLIRWLWQPLSRDITKVHRQLSAGTRVSWLGESPVPAGIPAVTELEQAVAAVQALLGETDQFVSVDESGPAVG
jgi:mitochondrial fission protein ELM1